MSKLKLHYISYVSDEGKIQSNVAHQIADGFKEFAGKRIQITVERLSAKRSDRQNRLYWLYVTIIAKEIGYAKEELHEIMKWQFLKRERVNERTGSVMYYTLSTAQLNKIEFADMVTDIIRWAAEEFEIVLPLPEEQTEMF